MRSWGQSHHDYEPEFWEFYYEINRYLEHMKTESLHTRHERILLNLRRLVCVERSIIPIDSFLSSWYWYKKEHQTRYELVYKRRCNVSIDAGKYEGIADISCPLKDPRTNLLFRFEYHKYADPFLEQGKIRIRPASVWKKLEQDEARCDNELQKVAYYPGERLKVTTESGQKIPVHGYMEEKAICANFYALCMTNGFHPDLFNDFSDTDCVIIIKRPDEFARRFEGHMKRVLSAWYFYHNPIEYYDPYEHDPTNDIMPGTSKDFLLAYQMEYRFCCFPSDGMDVRGDLECKIGPLEDIAEIMPKEQIGLQRY
jgi:hypothetical protein